MLRTLLVRLLVVTAAFIAAGCSSGGSPSGSRLAASMVSLKAAQQGQAGGFVDYDGDGIDDLIVAAPYATRGSSVGVLLVYRGTPSGFTPNPVYTLTGDDNFGYRFITMGDVDGDGKTDFAVASLNGSGEEVSLSGSVTIFKGGSRGAIIAKVAGEAALDRFGLSIAAGDVNGDGLKDLIVGAPFNSPAPDLYQGGSVYVFTAPDFAESARIDLPATTANTTIGGTVAAGDVNGDGIDDLLINTSKKVLVYYGGPGFSPSTDSPDVSIAMASSDSAFGSAISVIGDIDGDGYDDIAIGSAKSTVNGLAEVGRVYIVKGGTGTRSINLASAGDDLITRIDGGSYFGRFGFAITPVDTLPNDEGLPNFAVSAIHADREGAVSLETGLATGKVFLFYGKDLNAGETPITAAKAFSGAGRDMHFGTFLVPFSKNGPKLLIGAPTDKNQTGSVHAVSLKDGSSVFQAAGVGNGSTIGDDCCSTAAKRR